MGCRFYRRQAGAPVPEKRGGRMEDSRMEYSNIMESLLKKAHKNKNVLEYKEINDAFVNIPLTPDDFEWILNFLEKHNVDVLNTSEDNSSKYQFC